MCLMMVCLVLFTMSLQEGFYAYQLRHTSFTGFCSIILGAASQGLLIALWHSRLWFVWTLAIVFAHGLVNNLVSNYFPLRAPLKRISQGNTIFGYICAGIVVLVIHHQFSLDALGLPWFNVQPIKISAKPFDYDSQNIDMSAEMYKNQQFEWNLGPIGEYRFVTKPADLHLFAITMVVAVFGSFARVFADGIKKALRSDTLGLTMYAGGVVDHMAAVCFLGLFLAIYVD